MSSQTKRRAAAIHAYVGPNGGGKSLAMVYDTLPSLDVNWHCENPDHLHTQQGQVEGRRRVLSTVTLIDPQTGKPHDQYEKLEHWRQLLEVEHGDVLMDEVQGVASSRQHQSLPPAILNLILQLRRRDVLLRASAPAYARMDVALREVTQAVTFCKGFLGKREENALWPSNRMFLWRTYDALEFDEFTAGKREQLSTLTRQFYWRPGGDAHRWYDTHAAVSSISDATEGGTCLMCGGRRRRPSCSCAPEATAEGGAPRSGVLSAHDPAA